MINDEPFIINGVTWVKKSFFYENLEELRPLRWEYFIPDGYIIDDRHCEVCGRALLPKDMSPCYIYYGGSCWCDVSCYEDYIKGHGPNVE